MSGHANRRHGQPLDSPLPRNEPVPLLSLGSFQMPIKQGDRKRRKSELRKTLEEANAGVQRGGIGPANHPHAPSQHKRALAIHSHPNNQASSADRTPISGQNDYSAIQKSPESQAKFDAIMNNLGHSLYDVEEWDPELPSRPSNQDASPEHLTGHPQQPLTYTTVGSVVKPSDARQFTAPNRIQREGRAGLEMAGRRPIHSSTTPSRGQEFFSPHNAPQYPATQSYSQAVTRNLMHEKSPVRQYQPSQHDHRNTGQPSMMNHPPLRAGGKNFVQDQPSTATLSQFGAPSIAQNQMIGQNFTQQHSTGQALGGYSTSGFQSQLPSQNLASSEKSSGVHSLTAAEEGVLKSLGLPMPMASMASMPSRENNPLSIAGRSHPKDLTPIEEGMLAQLQAVNLQGQSGTNHHASAGTTNSFTGQQPAFTMNHDMSAPGSSTSNTARLQDAKMSTVQRLAQFPNPDQERAKARLAELAASKMRANDENRRPGRSDQNMSFVRKNSMQSGKDVVMHAHHDGRDGDSEVASGYQGNRAENELNYGFRFPNPSANPLQQTYAPMGDSSYGYSKTVMAPKKTPQGYPQPLTAGPPGQRQNNAPSSNKALNSMQQMLANGNQRNFNPYASHGLSQNTMQSMPMQSMPTQSSYAPQLPKAQQPSPGFNIIPDPKTYPWGKLDKQPRDFTDGAPPRVRETLSYEEALKFYPNGMDMDTVRSFITTLPLEEAEKHYPGGMDESTRKWYEEEHKWQNKPQSDLDLLLNSSMPFNEWLRTPTIRRENNFDTVHGSGPRYSGPGIIGQSRSNAASKADQPGDKKHLTLDEIKAMPLSTAAEYLFRDAFSTLSKYSDKTPESIAALRARGYGPAPEHAIDTRPNGNNSLFDPGWAQRTSSESTYRPSQPNATRGEKDDDLGNQRTSSGGGKGL